MQKVSIESDVHANANGIPGDVESNQLPSSDIREPQEICWSSICFIVGEKKVLSNCYGKVSGGKLCAIMGPSGAGKSSLLNVLAGRSASAQGIDISGIVTVSGKRIDPVTFRKHIAYVMQDDALMATATPREALQFSAALRLSSTTTKAEINDMVDKILVKLGIDSCADVLIGGALIKGISGGQRKRTSVGIEIITNPALLFLDEPTSGLDSFSAANLVQLLKEVAYQNATVLCTIHQPSSELFTLFDNVIFMKEGQIFYNGPPDKVVEFFDGFGYKCPSNYNPADFVMLLAQTEPMDTVISRGITRANQLDADNIAADLKLVADSALSSLSFPSSYSNFARTAGPIKQMQWIALREFRNIYRDVASLIGRFGVTIILSFLCGLIWLDVGTTDNGNSTDFRSHYGAVTLLSIGSMFLTAQPVALAFPFERPMFLRELSTGTYGAIPYFLGKLMLEIPVTLLQALVEYAIAYPMMKLRGNFGYEVLAAFGLGAASSSAAVMLGCAVTDVKDVAEMAPLLFVPQMLFSGFFIRTAQIPVFLRWAEYLCALKYSLNLIVITEFRLSSESCSDSEAAHENCRHILTMNNTRPDQWWAYAIALFLLFAAFRLVGAVILVRKARRFY